jgi:MGT family glycosyltransferase
MARIVVFTAVGNAHVDPYVALLVELRSRRHDVGFVMFAAAQQTIELAGLPILQVPWSDGSDPGLSGPGVGAGDVHQRHVAQIVARHTRSSRVDLLIVDPILWGAMIAAEASGLPWVSVSHNPYTIRGLCLDVRGPGYPPPRGCLERLQFLIAALRLRRAQAPALTVVNQVREVYHLAPLTELSNIYHRAPLTIAATAEPFEYPRTDWPPSYRFVGPLLWEPPATETVQTARLDDRTLILLSDTSVPRPQGSASWVGIALQALRNTPYQVIATVPAGIPGPLPPNVQVSAYYPHGQLLQRAACVVCHGGSGITHKALASGVPVVAVPDGYDRFEVARRVEVSGAGVMLPAANVTAERLRTAIDVAILRRSGAERVKRAFAQAGGAMAAAGAVEGLLTK